MGILQDIRFGLRAMAHSKMLTLVAVAALAVGIGLNTTVFSLVNAVLLKGLPFEEGYEIVFLRAMNLTAGQPMPVSRPEFKDWREQSTSFEYLAAYMGSPINLNDEEDFPESVNGTLVSPDIFRVARQPVLMGRDFVEEDADAGAEPVAIIGEGLWQRRYGGDPNILGRAIRANGLPFTIIGVMPLGMEFPNNSNIWFLVRDGDPDFDSREGRYFQVVGRLKDDVSPARADADMAAVSSSLAELYPDTEGNIGARVVTTSEFYNGGEIRIMFLALMGAMTFVLLIACANVANLRLAQTLRRTAETSIRTALGAGRWRIVRQLLTESLLLSVAGGLLGLGFAVFGVRLFDRAVSSIEGKPYWIDFSLDYKVFVYLGIVCVGTAILAGLMPALKASRNDVYENLKDGSRSSLGGMKSHRWASALIVAELSLTVVLLAGAGLMFRSLLNMQQVDFGVDTDGVIVAQVLLPREGYGEPEERIAFHDDVLTALESIPGLTASAIVSNAPGIGGASRRPFGIPGRDLTDAQGQAPIVDAVAVSHGFFETFSSPVRGRAFVETDGEEGDRVAIVNPAFAEAYWPGEDPIGRFIELGAGDAGAGEAEEPELETLRVVGVSQAIRHRIGPGEPTGAVPPTVYYPFRQEPPPYFSSILIRGNVDRDTLVNGMRTALASVDPDLPAADPRTYEEWLAEVTWPYRIFGGLFAIAAVMALVLSSAGIFGVTSFSIDQRTQEIGLRVALGATSRDVLWLVGRRGMVQLVLGLVLGGLGALAITRVLSGLLYGVGTGDPATLTAVVLLLSAVTVSACFFPARRATRLDPMSAIRFE